MAKEGGNPSLICSVRFLIAILACLCLTVNYMQRVNLTVAIVSMVNHSAVAAKQNEKTTTEIVDYGRQLINSSINANRTTVPSTSTHQKTSANEDGSFIWVRSTQGVILAGYFYGYLLTQAIGGIMAFKFGAQRVLLITVIASSLCTLISPMAAKWGYVFLFIVRFFTGLFASFNWPSLLHLLGEWSPARERSRLISISNSGSQIGTILTLPISGILCSLPFLGGWPLVFYCSGIFGLLWCLLWSLLARSTPESHHFISEREREYIKENKPPSTVNRKQKVPYKSIFTSIPCWGMFISHFFKAVGFYTILTNISTYSNDVLHMNLKKSGFLSAIPYIFYWLNTIICGSLADWLINSNKISRTMTRKIFTGLGNFLPGIFIFLLGFVTAETAWAGTLLFTLVLTTTGFNTGGGMYVSANDMAPKYAGIIWGISNTFGNLPGVICPTMVGAITKNGKVSEWRIVFTICAISYAISGLSFILTGTGEVQEWAKDAPVTSTSLEEDQVTDDAEREDTETLA